jgi:hypothetical protein
MALTISMGLFMTQKLAFTKHPAPQTVAVAEAVGAVKLQLRVLYYHSIASSDFLLTRLTIKVA